MDFALFIPVLLASIVLHEVAHAWQARREGDPTAEDLGRITLNPLAHLDPIGSVILPIVLWNTTGILFGWAKPVPVDPSRFREHPGSHVRVALAGIVANLLFALALTLIGAAIAAFGDLIPLDLRRILLQLTFQGIFINVLLGVFNLLPIPPLDGSHVVLHLLPERLAALYRKAGRLGFAGLFLLVFLVPDSFGVLLAPVEWLVGLADAFVRIWV